MMKRLVKQQIIQKKIFDNRCVFYSHNIINRLLTMKTATFINTFIIVCHETGEKKFENK